MTIETRSLFYYVNPVVLENRFLDFSEGGPNIPVEIPVGARSPQQLVDAVSAAHNELGALDYTWTFNRTTRKITVSSTSNFELNVLSGPNSGQSVFSLLGFTADKSGASSYEADDVFGGQLRPQFWFQNYIPPEHWVETVKATINEAGNGDIETFSFGKRKFYQLNIKFITDIFQGDGSPIEDIAGSVTSAVSFMQFIIDKTPIEIMLDRAIPTSFDTVLLESVVNNQDGTGFKLKELTSQGLAGYYETGNLVFRRVEN